MTDHDQHLQRVGNSTCTPPSAPWLSLYSVQQAGLRTVPIGDDAAKYPKGWAGGTFATSRNRREVIANPTSATRPPPVRSSRYGSYGCSTPSGVPQGLDKTI